MTDVTTLKGADAKLFIIPETTPNVTPTGADWERLVANKDFSPVVNLGNQPLTSVGSRRLIGFNKGGVTDVTFSVILAAHGNAWKRLLEAAMPGDGSGASQDRLPTFSLLAIWTREVGGTDELVYAELYNGCTAATCVVKKEMGPNPVEVSCSGRAQNMQNTETFSAGVPVFTGFQNITINSLEGLPSADLQPVMYFNWEEWIQYDGESMVRINRIGGWELAINNTIVPIPGRVVGADAAVYTVWQGFGTEGQTIDLTFNIVPQDFDYAQDYFQNKFIDLIRLKFTAPPNYGTTPDRQYDFQNSLWINPANIPMKKLVTATQQLKASFEDVLQTSS